MKIIEIIPQLGSGGAERFTVDLCNELAINHDVLLIVLHPLENHVFFANELSKKVKLISVNKKMGIDLLLPFKLRRIILKFNPDVVHTHLRAIEYSSLSVILDNKNIKYFHTVHNTAEKEAGGFINRSFRKFLFRYKYVQAITISAESKKSFQEFYGFNAPIIFNGRNIPTDVMISESVAKEIDSYRRTAKTRVLVNLARLLEQKRQGLIARTCHRLYNENYDFTILFIGRYGETSTMYKEVVDAACPVAHLLGERQNPLEYLKLADSYCLLSEYEGMPISLIEAMGTGAVPVCTPVGGIVDVIKDGNNGILAKDISEEECYIALKRFLDLSDKELAVMKEKTLASYSPFSMTECVSKYIKLFEQFVNNKK